MTPRFELKAATDDIHRELDDRLSQLDLAQEADYRRFLAFQARTVPPIEAALAAGGLGELVAGWSEARRGPALAADLAALDHPTPEEMPPPPIANVEQLLGMAYVLEGSRLGSRVLRKRVADGFPTAFLGDSPSNGPWPALIAVIDRLLYSNRRIGEAKAAARSCFALFLSVASEAGI